MTDIERLLGWLKDYTEQWGYRPSFVTFERNREGDLQICEVGLYAASSPANMSTYSKIIVDIMIAKEFATHLASLGYIRQSLSADSRRYHQSYAAPESEVGDIHGLGMLIPRMDEIDD